MATIASVILLILCYYQALCIQSSSNNLIQRLNHLDNRGLRLKSFDTGRFYEVGMWQNLKDKNGLPPRSDHSGLKHTYSSIALCTELEFHDESCSSKFDRLKCFY